MTQHVAYRWNGGVYCEDDIVAVLVETFPWHAWVELGNEPAVHDAETELDEIAKLFRIDREAPTHVSMTGFPEWIGRDHPGYCNFCHRWFTEDDDED